MADVPFSPSVGSLTATGLAPLNLAQGITFNPDTSVINSGFKIANRALTAYQLSHTFTVPELQLNCLTPIGYVPGNVTVVAFAVRSADLDSGGSALRQSIYLGASELVTGVLAGAGGTATFHVCTPTATTAPTLVYLKTTTAATTTAAGATNVTPYYYSS